MGAGWSDRDCDYGQGHSSARQGRRRCAGRAATPAQRGGYLRSFLDDIAGKVPANGLDTAAVLRSTRNVIRIQEAADRGEREVGFW